MSAKGKVYVNDIGTKIRTVLNENLTNMVSIVYEIKKPDDTEVEWTPVSTEDVIKGIVYYDTVSGDQDQVGEYFHQCYVIFSNGDEFRSETRSYSVYAKFK